MTLTVLNPATEEPVGQLDPLVTDLGRVPGVASIEITPSFSMPIIIDRKRSPSMKKLRLSEVLFSSLSSSR